MSWSAFRTFTDPDAYHAAFRDMRTASVITGRGDFRADFVTIQLDRVLLRDARETLPRTVYSAVDPRQFAIGFINDPRQQLYVNGLNWCRVRSSCSARHPRRTIVSFQLLDGAPSVCRTRILRLPGRP